MKILRRRSGLAKEVEPFVLDQLLNTLDPVNMKYNQDQLGGPGGWSSGRSGGRAVWR